MIKVLISNVVNVFKGKGQPYVFSVAPEMESVAQEFQNAVNARNKAYQDFDNAMPEMTDIAVYNLQAADVRLGLILQDAKAIRQQSA